MVDTNEKIRNKQSAVQELKESDCLQCKDFAVILHYLNPARKIEEYRRYLARASLAGTIKAKISTYYLTDQLMKWACNRGYISMTEAAEYLPHAFETARTFSPDLTDISKSIANPQDSEEEQKGNVAGERTIKAIIDGLKKLCERELKDPPMCEWFAKYIDRLKAPFANKEKDFVEIYHWSNYLLASPQKKRYQETVATELLGIWPTDIPQVKPKRIGEIITEANKFCEQGRESLKDKSRKIKKSLQVDPKKSKKSLSMRSKEHQSV